MPELVAATIAGLTFGLVLVMFLRVIGIESRAGRMQRQLDALTKHFGIDLSSVGVEEARRLMREGKKIEAIKAYRDCTGVGLAEAKEAVERIA